MYAFTLKSPYVEALTFVIILGDKTIELIIKVKWD